MENRRTRRTKRLLREALVQLVLERGYDNVTIESITETADLSRATFYAYFPDKAALLLQIVADLREELAERLKPVDLVSGDYFTGRAVRELFAHALEERDAYRIILRGEGNGVALREFIATRTAASLEVFRRRAEKEGLSFRMDPEVMTRAWVGEQVAVLQWWLEAEEPPMSVEEVSRTLLDLSLRGRLWASGFDEFPAGSLGVDGE
jgi:AcrR family transcriptional regulator